MGQKNQPRRFNKGELVRLWMKLSTHENQATTPEQAQYWRKHDKRLYGLLKSRGWI
jgi:hypothetical protein